MFAVISNEGLEFLGNAHNEALDALETNPGSTLHSVANLEELELALTKEKVKRELSDAFRGLTDKLDELGINEDLAKKVRENGKKLVGEVKSLGVRGMKAVGEGFVALGELLRKAGVEKEEDTDDETHCLC